MFKQLKILYFSLLFPFALFSGTHSGVTGFEFLRFEMGARPSGMGGAFTAVRGDLHGLAYNPAAISGLTDYQVTLTYMNHLSTFQAGFLGLHKKLPGSMHLGISLSYINNFHSHTDNVFIVFA